LRVHRHARRWRLPCARASVRDRPESAFAARRPFALGDKVSVIETVKHQLHEREEQLLAELRKVRRQARTEAGGPDSDLTTGQRIADTVAATMGSWRFIIVQSGLLFIWVVLNITAFVYNWDPYPFILLNLALSFQAAYAAPFIMMSQNRQQDIDRLAAKCDYEINIKAELEIELLHQKIDALRENEVLNLTKTVSALTQMLQEARAKAE
jgi:uncharacterized membrane protein